MHGTVPAHVYDVFADPENLAMFLDPSVNEATLNRLLQKRIRVYDAGEEYPYLSYTLLSNTTDGIEPSGVYQLPLAEDTIVADPDESGRLRYTFDAAEKAYVGALRPTVQEVAGKGVREVRALPQVHVTQEELFAAFPGVHYSLLCRGIPDTQRTLMRLLDVFPEGTLEHLRDGSPIVDPWGAVADWVATVDRSGFTPEQTAAIAELEKQAGAVMGRRVSSNKPVEPATFQALYRIYQQGEDAQEPAVLAAIAAIPDAEINQRSTHDGITPLMIAVRLGMPAAVTAMLARPGLALDLTNFVGLTALHLAARSGNAAIVKQLLDAGASHKVVDEDGETPLMLAAKHATLEGLLPRLAADGAALMVDDYGDTALHHAVLGAFAGAIPALMAVGVPPTKPNNAGLTPLMVACKDGSEAIALAFIDAQAGKIVSPKALALAVTAKKEAVAIRLVQSGSLKKDFDKLIAYAEKNGMNQLADVARVLKQAAEGSAAAGGGK